MSTLRLRAAALGQLLLFVVFAVELAIRDAARLAVAFRLALPIAFARVTGPAFGRRFPFLCALAGHHGAVAARAEVASLRLAVAHPFAALLAAAAQAFVLECRLA